MPSIVRRFIKTAALFLVFGLLLGTFMLVRRELSGIWPEPYLVSAHTHAVFVGFIMFMIMGVALWLFPKPLPGDRRYRAGLVEMVYWLLVIGTSMRVIGEVFRTYTGPPELAWLVIFAGVTQVIGLLIFVWLMWNRVRPSARVLREGKSSNDN